MPPAIQYNKPKKRYFIDVRLQKAIQLCFLLTIFLLENLQCQLFDHIIVESVCLVIFISSSNHLISFLLQPMLCDYSKVLQIHTAVAIGLWSPVEAIFTAQPGFSKFRQVSKINQSVHSDIARVIGNQSPLELCQRIRRICVIHPYRKSSLRNRLRAGSDAAEANVMRDKLQIVRNRLRDNPQISDWFIAIIL